MGFQWSLWGTAWPNAGSSKTVLAARFGSCESLGLWRELEADSGETLLELNGLLEIVGSLEESTARTLEACGVEWYRLSGEEEGFANVRSFEIGVQRQDLLRRLPFGDQGDDGRNRNSKPAQTGNAPHLARVGGDSRELHTALL